MNRIYLFDVDGTLSKNGIIPPSAIHALEALRRQGDLVMLATGRCLGQMKDILSMIQIDGAILNNGALVIVKNKILFSSWISNQTILNMLSNKLHLAFLTKDEYLRIEEHEIFQEFVQHFNLSCPKLVDGKYLLSQNIYSIGLYGKNIEEADLKKYPELRFVQVCPIGYDVMNQGIHKASGMKALRKEYPMAEIIAFGDNYNDIELLKEADISVAMANAPMEVKSCSDYVTLDPLEDGIYFALKEYLKSI